MTTTPPPAVTPIDRSKYVYQHYISHHDLGVVPGVKIINEIAAAIAAAEHDALERAAAVCEGRAQKYNMPYRGYNVAAQESEQCAADIRALMAEKP